MTTFAYDYQNQYTRGWVRAEFDPRDFVLANDLEATAAFFLVAGTWANGTDLRLVEIADDGTETFPQVTAKGNRGPLPKDKKEPIRHSKPAEG